MVIDNYAQQRFFAVLRQCQRGKWEVVKEGTACLMRYEEETMHGKLTVQRFDDMLEERGLSSYSYTAPRYSKYFGRYDVHYIDVGKDGKVLATYDIDIILEYFGEQCMTKELDDLIKENDA